MADKIIKLSIETTIFPDPGRLIMARNPVWWRSIFIGITFPLIHLPQITFFTLVLPILVAMRNFIWSTVGLMFIGLVGKLVGIKPPEVIKEIKPQQP